MRASVGSSGRTVAALGVLAAALFVLAPSASAATIPVTNTDNAGSGSLRAAINSANAAPNPPHLVDATGVSGTINLQIALPSLSQDVEIRGPGPGALTVRRGVAAEFRIFAVNSGVEASLSGLTIANGLDSVQGGGVANFGGELTVANSVVRNNMVTSAQGGGGLFTRNDGSLTVRNTTVTNNTVTGTSVPGGGIRTTFGSDLTVVNSTVTGNTAPVGGGISNGQTGSDATILNTTVVGNTAPDGANLSLAGFDDTRILRSTILAEPLGGGENCSFLGDESPSQGYNLADDASCRLTRPTDQPNTDPMLGPLAANGGPTRTMALPLSSPAVDKGIRNGLTTDQRGLTRPVDLPDIPNAPGGDGTDIGAFEVQAFPAPPPNGCTDNQFEFGKVKKNKKRGKAKLTVNVPCPGGLELAKTKKIKPDDEVAEAAGDEKLKIKPKRRAKRKLRRKGKAKVKAEVTYTPDGGEPNTQSKKLKLKKRR